MSASKPEGGLAGSTKISEASVNPSATGIVVLVKGRTDPPATPTKSSSAPPKTTPAATKLQARTAERSKLATVLTSKEMSGPARTFDTGRGHSASSAIKGTSDKLKVQQDALGASTATGAERIRQSGKGSLGAPTVKDSSWATRSLHKGAASALTDKEAGKDKAQRESSEKPMSFLAAAATVQPKSQVSMAKSLPPREKRLPQPQQHQSTLASKRKRPSATLELDLLTLAIKSKKADEKRKQLQQQGHASAKAAHAMKEAERVEKRIGKVKGAGEVARRRNRLSSLKKRIIHERIAVWFLTHPEAKPFPLVVNPALIDFECVWVPQATLDMITTDERNSLAKTQGAEEESNEAIQAQHGLDKDESEAEMSDEDDAEVIQEESDDSENSIDDPSEVNSEDDEETDDEKDEVANDTEPSSGNTLATNAACDSRPVGFNPELLSPIFFGAFYRLQGPTSLSPALGKEKDLVKKKPDAPKIRSTREVRDYVDQALSKRLDDLCSEMLKTLFKFQERARKEDPVNAKMRRRIVMGLHEVRRGVRSHRCIAVIISPNVEDAAGLDDKLEEILDICRDDGEKDAPRERTPVIFAMNKRSMGRALGKKANVSCVGIYSADGAHEQFKQVLKLSQQLAKFWQSQVGDERRLTRLGMPSTCDICVKPLAEAVRRDCLNCKRVFCMACASSIQAKKPPCPSSASGTSDKSANPPLCEIVRVARDPPPPILPLKSSPVRDLPKDIASGQQPQAKCLRPEAQEFVPTFPIAPLSFMMPSTLPSASMATTQ